MSEEERIAYAVLLMIRTMQDKGDGSEAIVESVDKYLCEIIGLETE